MTGNETAQIGGLLLAAGGSRRFGSPKQLLQFHGKSLLRRAAETLVKSQCDPVIVVLGAEFEKSNAEIFDLPLGIVVNEDWRSGMSSSIRTGLRELLRVEPNLAATVITLCDQPHITAEHIDLLIKEHKQTGAAVVAAEYGGTTGVPALFSASLFNDLLALRGDQGARHLIRDGDDATTIKLDEAAFDIDTRDDLNRPAAKELP
jgi:molybdenum cofactor cytidylyltransferase